jgi:putative peptide zinc metalloprotease protein
VLFVPLPYKVRCSLEILPKEAHWIYVVVPGKVVNMPVRPGQHVDANTLLCSLVNEDLQREVVELEGQLAETNAEIDSLIDQRSHDTRIGLQVKPAKERLATVGALLQEKREKLKQLQVVSPIEGTVIPPPMKTQERTPPGQLPAWSGSPFDKKNSGAHFAESDLVCLIGDPQQVEAVLVVDQADIELVRVKQPVYIKLDAYPGHVFSTEVAKIANDKMESSPLSLSIQGGGDLDTRTDATGQHRTLTPSYQVRTDALNQDGLALEMGMRGRGKIATAWQSIGKRVYRYLSRTFHFDL